MKCMNKERTKLEKLMKEIGDVFGINYRFHRWKAIRTPKYWQMLPNNALRQWAFEWWKRVPGNPLNECINGIDRHELHVCNVPNSVKAKDEAIEHVLFKTYFMKDICGQSICSYDALKILLDLYSRKDIEL